MKFVIVHLLIAIAFFQDGFAWSIQFFAGEISNNKTVNCSNISGSTCSSSSAECGSVFWCIPNMKEPLKGKCDTGLTCNAGSCSTIKSSLCEYGNKTFKCNTLGMYPEPSSCKKFNFCVPSTANSSSETPTPIKAKCEDGWGYNSVTTSCDKPLRDNNCVDNDRPVPPCLTTGQNGALKDNPTMYYICMAYGDGNEELYPSIFKCPRNTKYSGNFICK